MASSNIFTTAGTHRNRFKVPYAQQKARKASSLADVSASETLPGNVAVKLQFWTIHLILTLPSPIGHKLGDVVESWVYRWAKHTLVIYNQYMYMEKSKKCRKKTQKKTPPVKPRTFLSIRHSLMVGEGCYPLYNSMISTSYPPMCHHPFKTVEMNGAPGAATVLKLQ